MSKGAFPTQSFIGNYGNFGLPPMAFTNTFMPPKPNYQPLMKMQPQVDPRAGFLSIQQPPVQQDMSPPIEPMVTPTQPLTTTPQPLAQAPSLLNVPDRVEQPRDRFMSINRRGLPPINLFR